MTDGPTPHELSERIARIEEGMKTMQADNQAMHARYEGAIDRMQADMAKRDADMARRDADMARRDKANIQWMIGMTVASVLLIIGVLGFLIRFPTPPA